MEFTHKIPDWKNEGVEPSNELKTSGFIGGMRPPADVFNFFWSKVTKAITELQTKFKTNISEKLTAGGTGSALTVTTSGTVEDGTQITLKLPADIQNGATLAANSGAALPIKNPDGTPIKGGQKVGSYLNVIYSNADMCWYLVGGAGGGGVEMATAEEALAGIVADKSMSPLTTKKTIDKVVGDINLILDKINGVSI